MGLAGRYPVKREYLADLLSYLAMKDTDLILKSAASPQTLLSGFNAAVYTAVARTFSAYSQFIPAILWTWLAVEFIVPALGYKSSIALLLLLPTGLAAYAAAAAKASGRFQEGVIRLYLVRFSAVLDYCWLYSLFLIGCLVLTITLSFFGDINRGGFIAGLLPLYGLLFLLMCTRLWPMIAVPFLKSEDDVQSFLTGLKVSGLGQAWALTRRKGTLLHMTLPLFIAGGILLGSYLMLRPAVESSMPGLLLLNIFLYAIILPFFITLTDILAEQLESAGK